MDWLKELLVSFWDWVKPFEIVLEYEGGVHLRCGRYLRTLGPGFWWKLPLFDYCLTCTTAVTTERLEAQPLTTQDNVQIDVKAIVKIEVKDAKLFLLTIWDSQDAVQDLAMGAIRAEISRRTYEQCLHESVEEDVLKRVRREVSKHGIGVLAVTFIAFAKAKTLHIQMNSNRSEPRNGH